VYFDVNGDQKTRVKGQQFSLFLRCGVEDGADMRVAELSRRSRKVREDPKAGR
jgi:hypothetical protein